VSDNGKYLEGVTQIKSRGSRTINSSVTVKCWSLKKLNVKSWEKTASALRKEAAAAEW